MISLQAVKRPGELFANGIGIAERRMGPLADEDNILPWNGAAGVPVAEDFLRLSPGIDIGRIEQIAACLVIGVQGQGTGGKIREELKSERHG